MSNNTANLPVVYDPKVLDDQEIKKDKTKKTDEKKTFKISTQAEAKETLFFMCAMIWVIIQVIIWIIFRNFYFLYGTVPFLLIFFFSFKQIVFKTEMNNVNFLLNLLTGKIRAVSEGSHWKLPWEILQPQYAINTQTEIACKADEDFPAQDGTVSIRAAMLVKPDITQKGIDEREFSKRMITFASFTPTAIKGIIESFTINKIREYCKGEQIDAVIKATSEMILPKRIIGEKWIYSEIEEMTGSEVKKSIIEDIDYDEKTKNAKNALMEAETLKKMVDVMMKDDTYTKEEAKSIAPFINKESNLKKEVFDVNITGVPNLRDVNFFPPKKGK